MSDESLAPDKTWQKNANSQIVLNSIFAALAAVWITIALSDDKNVHTWLKFFEVHCALFSFFLFALSAEGATNAYDEKDVTKFVYSMLWYNVGVILIGAAIGLLIFAHFLHDAIRFLNLAVPSLSRGGSLCAVLVPYLLLFWLLLRQWMCDSWWIVFGPEGEHEEYIDELEDRATPTKDRRWLMRLILFRWRLDGN